MNITLYIPEFLASGYFWLGFILGISLGIAALIYLAKDYKPF